MFITSSQAPFCGRRGGKGKFAEAGGKKEERGGRSLIGAEAADDGMFCLYGDGSQNNCYDLKTKSALKKRFRLTCFGGVGAYCGP